MPLLCLNINDQGTMFPKTSLTRDIVELSPNKRN